MEFDIFLGCGGTGDSRRADMVHPAILLRAQKGRRPGDAA